MEDSDTSKGIVRRDVVEVLPGTLTTDRTLNDKSNRYIGSLFFAKNVGFLFLTPQRENFYVGQCDEKNLHNNLLKFCPQEVVISNKIIY